MTPLGRNILTACLASLALPSLASAAGVLASRAGAFSIESVRVKALVEESVATTEVEQVFRNKTGQPQEAVYDFPLPPRGTFTALSIWVNGKEVQGEVVARARAESVYTDVTGVEVAKPDAPVRPGKIETPFKRDPGLLETTSGRDVRLRVAPVPAGGTQRVRIRYVEPVSIEAGRGRYVLPLVSSGAASIASHISCEVTLASKTMLASATCPSHPEARVRVLAPGEVFKLEFEKDQARLDRDLELRFEREPLALPALTVAASRRGEGPGTALLALTPVLPPDARAAVGRDVIFLFDASGSMEGHRKAALAAIEAGLAALAPDDRFDVVAFSLGARARSGKLVPATREARERALGFLTSFTCQRGTDLRTAFDQVAAIVRASDKPRALDLVLVTDGSLSASSDLVRAVEARARAARARVFALELGESRAPGGALDRLVRRTGGLAVACPDADALANARDLAKAIALPVLRAPTLRLEGIALEEVRPEEPPAALFPGTQIAILGRYTKPGKGTAVLEADLPDGRRVFWRLPVELPAIANDRDVERLHAQARTDELLAALAGQSLAATERQRLEQDLQRVSLEAQILTPATSLLVLESEAMFRDYGIERRNSEKVEEDRAAEQERREDVERLVEQRKLEGGSDQLAMNSNTPGGATIWHGARGGGAGEPLLLALAFAAVGSSFIRRRGTKR